MMKTAFMGSLFLFLSSSLAPLFRAKGEICRNNLIAQKRLPHCDSPT